jgi:NAD(P)-dependent dehydrogenase (short-subunit alcohol dehydrogenase family)
MRFEGKTAVVTGAAGGVGQVLSRKLAAQGASVVLADLKEEACAQLAQEIRAQGGRAVHCAGDVRARDYCERLVEVAQTTFGGLDILANNAGVIPRGDILDTTDEMWRLALDVNLTSAFFLSRAAIPLMRQRGGGAIVNTSSAWGIHPGPRHLAYNTSKAALAAFTQSLGMDHAPHGIRVNAVCPNEVNTPMLRSGFTMRGLDPEKAVADLGKTVPLGRIAEPEDIVDVILFLASDEARYIAGELIEVTGAKPVGA